MLRSEELERLESSVKLWASRTPDAWAVCDAHNRITYSQLWEWSSYEADRLAVCHRPGRRIALVCGGVVQRVVGLLAIWRSGHTCVPLEPSMPADRVRHVVEHSSARAVLTEPSDSRAYDWIMVDRHTLSGKPPATAQESGVRPALSAGEPAYIVYTSGSTGQPKGVLSAHRGAARVARAAGAFIGVRPDDVVAQIAPFSFDFSMLEILTALSAGAQLAIGDHRLSHGALERWIRANAVTVIMTTASRLATVDPSQVPSVRIAVHAGERCPNYLPACWLPFAEFYNAYGATESSMISTVHRCVGASGEGLTLGEPVGGSKVYVLSPTLKEVAEGEVGEAYLGGDVLAQGYVKQPGLTAERFIPDPFASRPGGRLYRTGDLVRRGAGNAADFCGRSDRQVKIRGVRVELGEVEAHIQRLPGVIDGVIVAWHSSGDEQPTLVAYVQCSADISARVVGWRQSLRQSLPDAMIPAHFVQQDTWPLTAHGKLDYDALPPPAPMAVHDAAVIWIPPLEDRIAALWTDVSGVSLSSRDESFFDSGGTSFLIAVLSDRLSNEFRVHVPAAELFEHDTVPKMAQWLARAPHLEDIDRNVAVVGRKE